MNTEAEVLQVVAQESGEQFLGCERIKMTASSTLLSIGSAPTLLYSDKQMAFNFAVMSLYELAANQNESNNYLIVGLI